MTKENIIINFDDNITAYVKDIFGSNKIDILSYVTKIAEYILKNEGVDVNKIYISIESATKDEIKNLNAEYRNIDKVTDVLSFPIFEKNELEEISKLDNTKKIKEIELGDIVLCLDVIKEQSIEYETGMLREVLYMITHGICHLVGYDHIEESDKVKMRDLEERALNIVNITKNK